MKTKDGEFRDLTGELSSKLLGKRITQMQKSRKRLSELSPKIDSLKNAIHVAQSCGHKYQQLKALLHEIKQFQLKLIQEDIPEEAFVSNHDWPVAMICTLSNIVQEIGTFKENIETCVKQEHCIKVSVTGPLPSVCKVKVLGIRICKQTPITHSTRELNH